ncbi:MAG: DAK2 domain-containing protein [Oscillospiraceae bacterium]|nr:DAK2 domain-containing protein [Oscillospiraceae bacterium]
MIFCASAALDAHRQQLNDLNVFPVPDGDTGTNMSMTMASAAQTLRENIPADVGDASNKAASALLRGARGNSGVILSLLFRGMAKSLKGKAECSAAEWARAMNDGVDAAYKAVMKPAEGTVLTVSRRAGETAATLAKGGVADIEEILAGALETARETLAQTVEMNPVLKKAGVVDAGGQGYVFILEAMLQYLRGEFTAQATAQTKEKADFTGIEDEEITFTYCTEFIVAREYERSPELLRAYLNGIGDSLVLVEDDEIIKVHVHTDAPGRALTEALRYGPLQTVKIENMRNQHTHLVDQEAAAGAEAAPAEPEPEFAPPEKEIGFVAVCAGKGMQELFLSLGADRVVTGGQTMNPSTEDILTEINRTPAETVFVFPNNKNLIMAAEQCVPLCDKEVRVIPTTTVPQGVSALAYMEPDQTPDELDAAFRATAGTVHTALVTYAARDSEFDGQTIKAGEHLALLDGKLLGSYPDVDAMFEDLNRALEALEPEFLTVYYGADVTAEDAEDARACLGEHFPEADISVIGGGQPVYYYMISAE